MPRRTYPQKIASHILPGARSHIDKKDGGDQIYMEQTVCRV